MPRTRLRVRWTAVIVIGVAVLAGLSTIAVGSALGATLYDIAVPLSLLFAGAAGIAIPLTLIAPAVGTGLAVAALIAFSAIAAANPSAPWPVAAHSTVALCFVLAIAGTVAPWAVGASGWLVAVAGILVITALRDPGPVGAEAVVADLTVFAAVTLIVLCTGILLRAWRDSQELLAQEREIAAAEAGRREIVEERNRIARELHDIVAHGMSAIQVQAASARYRLPDLPADAAAEFDTLAATARTAMGEMRLLLGVLRDDRAEQAPQPGLRELRDLLTRPGHGGALTVEDTLTDAGGDDPLAELAAYRLVQESLSNVARHAPGADVSVRLRRDADGAIALRVRNAAPPGRVPAPGAVDRGGHGIAGMRERVALLGGALRAEPTDDGGFEVAARIPPTEEAR